MAGREPKSPPIVGFTGKLLLRLAGPSAAVRSLYAEYAWLGILNAGMLTFAPVYVLRQGGEPFLLGLLSAGPALTGLIISFPGSALIARARDPWRLMLQTRLLA